MIQIKYQSKLSTIWRFVTFIVFFLKEENKTTRSSQGSVKAENSRQCKTRRQALNFYKQSSTRKSENTQLNILFN